MEKIDPELIIEAVKNITDFLEMKDISIEVGACAMLSILETLELQGTKVHKIPNATRPQEIH